MGLLIKKEPEGVEMLSGGPPSSTDGCEVETVKSRIPPWIWVLVAFAFLLFLGGLICFIVALSARHNCPRQKSPTEDNVCSYSDEANRVRLPDFLQRVQSEHYVMNANNVPWKPITDEKEAAEHTKTRYSPYNPDPMYLKKKTDRAMKLLDEINSVVINQNKMKPREVKALAQVKHFLQHTFGAPYAENYYAGDWMLGPDLFCWQPICYVSYDVSAYASRVKPETYDDVQLVIGTLKRHKSAIDRYRKNLALGVEAGMIRTLIDCQAGVDALKESYRKLALANSSDGVLGEWFAKPYLEGDYLAGLESGVNDQWAASHGQSVNASIREALKEGLGEPLLELINHLQFDHMRHCLPNNLASGLASLPVDYVYNNGIPDKNRPTVKKLPTGEPLNGSESYKLILSYFTTTDISPEEIFQEGKKQLKFFYDQVIEIAKEYTGKANETEAVEAFRNILNSSSMWHNNGSFPRNESNENAHNLCVSPETAAKFCPVRWKAVNRWAKYCRQVMGMLYPKINKLFYFTGPKITAPNCPIEMLPHYNPSNGAQFFQRSDAECSTPTYFGLPFFLKDFGPVFQEWSVTGHESRPGHHTEYQGNIEHFSDKCGGVPGWLDSITYYTAYGEGWGLYSENPLLSDDTDTYKNNLLQRYGMVKWQTWRAVRLIVDTGLHYRGLTRTQALNMFEKYAWDTSDFAVKEVTRYQSDPGQATAYMLGRLALIELRNKTEVALGKNFSLKDFHYQVLSQGSAPLSFLQSHIDRYIKCVQGKLGEQECSYVLKPVNADKKANGHKSVQNMPLRPQRRHYV